MECTHAFLEGTHMHNVIVEYNVIVTVTQQITISVW